MGLFLQLQPYGVFSLWMLDERPSFRNPCYAQRQQLQWTIFSQLQRILQRRIPLLWFIQHGSLLRIPVLHGIRLLAFQSSFWTYDVNMYSAGCGMQMNSMNRNFGNQFNGNQFSDNQCFGNQFNGNQFSGNQCFGNQYYGFPENFMSSYGQY